MVKRLRHHPFTVVSRVRISLASSGPGKYPGTFFVPGNKKRFGIYESEVYVSNISRIYNEQKSRCQKKFLKYRSRIILYIYNMKTIHDGNTYYIRYSLKTDYGRFADYSLHVDYMQNEIYTV